MLELISAGLMAELKHQYRLHWDGIHGFSHWQRVRDNGLRLAQETGANTLVVEYFAFIHDICRQNDSRDPEHGKRAAIYLESLQDDWLHLDRQALELLKYACEFHTSGWTEGDITVLPCWDAARLDLGRAFIRPDPRRLCTPAARQPEVLAWAYERSIQ